MHKTVALGRSERPHRGSDVGAESRRINQTGKSIPGKGSSMGKCTKK